MDYFIAVLASQFTAVCFTVAVTLGLKNRRYVFNDAGREGFCQACKAKALSKDKQHFLTQETRYGLRVV
jgi:mitochondrial fission protein ELM1